MVNLTVFTVDGLSQRTARPFLEEVEKSRSNKQAGNIIFRFSNVHKSETFSIDNVFNFQVLHCSLFNVVTRIVSFLRVSK